MLSVAAAYNGDQFYYASDLGRENRDHNIAIGQPSSFVGGKSIDQIKSVTAGRDHTPHV
jgi:isocitrate lyase